MTRADAHPVKAERGALWAPAVEGSLPPTSKDSLDAALQDLRAKRDEWAGLSLSSRVAILDRLIDDFQRVEQRWVERSIVAKGIDSESFGAAEEWTVVASIHGLIHQLRRSLREIQLHGMPQPPGKLSTRANGQLVVPVFPSTTLDGLIMQGITAEIWMQPDVTSDNLSSNLAAFYRQAEPRGKVTVVLGAGNSSILPPADCLCKLFNEGKVVALKMNPVNDYLGPLMEEAFGALIEPGYLRVLYGGAKEGAYLCKHQAVDDIHITGSDKTFEAIVFGSGEEGALRKQEGVPELGKPITAELGNVSPIIIVPGPWNERDVQQQARRLATWLVVNAGYNCLTPRIIIQHREWPLRGALSEAIGRVLAEVETRRAYYPGAEDRHSLYLSAHPDARLYGNASEDELPWTYVSDVNPAERNDICFSSEAFCGIFAETALSAGDTASYLEQAVSFANETLWGNLTATLVVHPDSLADPRAAAATEKAIADLAYGTVTVNLFSGLAYSLGCIAWGAYPGNEITDIQSGIGFVLNTLMFDRPQKSVVRGRFRQTPDPFVVGAKNIVPFTRKLVEFQRQPAWSKLPGILLSALGTG